MQQARSIRQQARGEVEAVCANSSLSPQQKRQQIQAVRQKERQQLDAVISPAQEQSLQACRRERGLGGHAGGGGFGKVARREANSVRVHLINPSGVSFGAAVITPRWLYVLAAATPCSFGDSFLVNETQAAVDPAQIEAGVSAIKRAFCPVPQV